jgi:type IV secretion system protein VirB2
MAVFDVQVARTSLANPPDTSVLLAAVNWIEGTLLGTLLATIIAVIAIAGIGFMMLAGRIDLKRGASVLLGCFVLFGASAIANGLLQAVSGVGNDNPVVAVAPPPRPLVQMTEPPDDP